MAKTSVSMRTVRLLGWTLVASFTAAYLVYFASVHFFSARLQADAAHDHASSGAGNKCQCVPEEKIRADNAV
jgi:hypothetical protein